MDMGKKHNTIKTKEKIKSAFTELIMERDSTIYRL